MNGEQNLNTVLSDIKEKGKYYCYTKGISMLPMLKEGRDISVLVSVPEKLCIGDVVMFSRPERDNELVLHRIVKITPEGNFYIRGDNTFWDEPVKRENVLALLEGFFRKGKYTECAVSRGYRLYTFYQLKLYPLRRFIFHTLRIAGAKIKNNVFHLNNLHLDDIFKRR